MQKEYGRQILADSFEDCIVYVISVMIMALAYGQNMQHRGINSTMSPALGAQVKLASQGCCHKSRE